MFVQCVAPILTNTTTTTTCMILKTSPRIISRPFLHSILSCSSSSLNVVEPNYLSADTSLYGTQNPSIQTPFNGFKKVARRVYDSSWPNFENKSNGVERATRSRIGRGLDLGLDRKGRLKRYSAMLRDCVVNWGLNEGKAIHGDIVRSGVEPDSHLWVSLINFYAKCRCLEFAHKVFDEMPERDVVSCTALIAGYVGDGRGMEGVYLLCEMQRDGIRPNEFTLATVLKACSMQLDKEFGKQIHAEVVKIGVFEDLYVGSALVDLYAKCGEMEYADKVFFFMPEQNTVSWNGLLNGYAEVGDGAELLRLFCRMKETEMKFNKFTLSIVLKGCANSGDLGAGLLVHSVAIKIGCEDDDFVNCSLVDMYSKCGIAYDALKVFSRIKNPDIVTWSAMICCLDQQGRAQEAIELFSKMKHKGLNPNHFTLASLINAATDLGDPNYSKSIHACVYKYGFELETLVNNSLITMYMKNGFIEDGYRVFHSMCHWDVVSWNTLLSGFQDNETCDQGPRFFNSMLGAGFKPNIYTFITILRSCSSLSNPWFGRQVHTHVVKNGLKSDGYVGTALIDMYAKCRCLEDVEVIFNRMNEKDIFTWTVMIAGFAQTDQGEKAVNYFNHMRKNGVNPNEFTLASCLRGCSGIASFENGRQLHSLAIKTGHFRDIFVAGAIVDMYGKCGSIDDAEIIFRGVGTHDTILWNTIICNYALHGFGEKALQAFEDMLDEGTLPDGITFLGVLSACSHMGLIDEGRKHFESMSEVHKITPSIKHYACMVDILGRAGKFNEVESFVENMQSTPNALIWETILGACKVYGNAKLGERAAEKLFEIEPEIDSNYILLSNIFAGKGRWGDVSKIRALMTNQGIKKEPGCSWVEVDSQIHTFLAQDSSHPKIRDIHQKLEELGDKLTKSGYIPKTDYVLQNVTEREKRENLSHHSERLALGFSMINSIPNKTIRIFKNLRICGDCHEYMKLVSDITEREIVVRDIHRFHHFQTGRCSCKDYW
ncbi:hypothetical protein LguiB_005404 [Lonicera macranthoides]